MGTKKSVLDPGKMRFIIMLALLFLAVLMVYQAQPNMEKAKLERENATKVTFSKLLESPSDYAGQQVTFEGDIINLVSREDSTSVYLAVTLPKDESLKVSTDYPRTSSNQAVVDVIYVTNKYMYDTLNIGDNIKVTADFQKIETVNGLEVPVLSNL